MGHALTFYAHPLRAHGGRATLLNIPGALRFPRARWIPVYISPVHVWGSLMFRPSFERQDGQGDAGNGEEEESWVLFVVNTCLCISGKSWVDVTAYSCPDSVTPLLDYFLRLRLLLLCERGCVRGCKGMWERAL